MHDTIRDALGALRVGRFVVVSDAADREDEADLVLAAQHATPERLAFLMRHTAGIVCAPMVAAHADALGLPLMVTHNTERHGTAFTVSVDAADGVTTGISASDRAATLRTLAEPGAAQGDFVRPGHVFPLRAHPGGLQARSGHTEAAVELMRLAGLTPVAVICELIGDDGEVLGHDGVAAFAARHGLPRLDISEIAAAGLGRPLHAAAGLGRPLHAAAGLGRTVEPLAAAPLPTRHGTFDLQLLRTRPDDLEHIVLTLGDPAAGPCLVRIHSECATGDLFGSRRCDCGEQLRAAMEMIGDAGRGVIVYERGHEGRGIGLADKLRAYALQDRGADTVDANVALGHPADARDFRPAAAVLARLGLRNAVLLTNNPDKVAAVRAEGIAARARPLRIVPHPDNVSYLETKRLRCGHDLIPADTDAAAV